MGTIYRRDSKIQENRTENTQEIGTGYRSVQKNEKWPEAKMQGKEEAHCNHPINLNLFMDLIFPIEASRVFSGFPSFLHLIPLTLITSQPPSISRFLPLMY